MTSQQLGVFRAVGIYLNFSKAAESLYVSQSYISKQISALEKEWNLRLFRRDHHGVAFTAAGQYLFDFFSEYQERITAAVRYARELEQMAAAPLSLGVSATLESRHLPEIIRVFRQTHPAATVTVSFQGEEALMNGFLSGKYDLAVTNLGAVSNPAALYCRPLRRASYHICVSRTLLPAGIGPAEALDRLRGLPHIDLLGAELSSRRLLDQVRRKFQVPMENRLDAPNPESLYRMVESEMGYSFVTVLPANLPPEPRITFVDTEIECACVAICPEAPPPDSPLGDFLRVLTELWTEHE